VNRDLIHIVYLSVGFLTLFASAEFLYHKLKVQAEYTRKYVHVATGLITLLFPVLVESHWFILIICGSFLFILIGSLKFGLLPSINAVQRTTRGSILYPFVVYGCFLLFQEKGTLVYYYLPILILAICDPIAALGGRKFNYKRYQLLGQTKTIGGSVSFLLAAFVVSTTYLLFTSELTMSQVVYGSLLIGSLSTIAEAVSFNGYDNLTIPASVVLALLSLENITRVIF
jgi:phytol kinase